MRYIPIRNGYCLIFKIETITFAWKKRFFCLLWIWISDSDISYVEGWTRANQIDSTQLKQYNLGVSLCGKEINCWHMWFTCAMYAAVCVINKKWNQWNAIFGEISFRLFPPILLGIRSSQILWCDYVLFTELSIGLDVKWLGVEKWFREHLIGCDMKKELNFKTKSTGEIWIDSIFLKNL